MVGAVSPIGVSIAPATFQRFASGSRAAGEATGEAIPGAKGTASAGEAKSQGDAAKTSAANPQGLTAEQQAQVQELKKRDQEVRQHEAAHAATGGQYAGAPSYTYTSGPDGKRYATGGEVSIDASPVAGDPAATIQKLRTVIAAALAPASPSGQDRAVAAQAQAALAQAQVELSKEGQAALSGEGKDGDKATGEGKTAAESGGAHARAAGAYRDTAETGGKAATSLIGALVA
jgi:hypothetical protein